MAFTTIRTIHNLLTLIKTMTLLYNMQLFNYKIPSYFVAFNSILSGSSLIFVSTTMYGKESSLSLYFILTLKTSFPSSTTLSILSISIPYLLFPLVTIMYILLSILAANALSLYTYPSHLISFLVLNFFVILYNLWV